jgi:hypothetical protein
MLDVQSRLLRQLVKSHSQLKDQWKQSRERLLVSPGVGEENAITLGESHVILELQMSNQVSNFSLCLPFPPYLQTHPNFLLCDFRLSKHS